MNVTEVCTIAAVPLVLVALVLIRVLARQYLPGGKFTEIGREWHVMEKSDK